MRQLSASIIALNTINYSKVVWKLLKVYLYLGAVCTLLLKKYIRSSTTHHSARKGKQWDKSSEFALYVALTSGVPVYICLSHFHEVLPTCWTVAVLNSMCEFAACNNYYACSSEAGWCWLIDWAYVHFSSPLLYTLHVMLPSSLIMINKHFLPLGYFT